MAKPVIRLARNQPSNRPKIAPKPIKLSNKLTPKSNRPHQIGGDDNRRGVKIITVLDSTMKTEFTNRFHNVIRDNVRVRYIGKTQGSEGDLRYNFTTTESDQHTERPVHNQVVAKLQPTLPWANSRIAARCSCSDWIYRCEYVWAQKRAALAPMQSNGEPPHKTNPLNRLFGCKHLLVIMSKLLKTK